MRSDLKRELAGKAKKNAGKVADEGEAGMYAVSHRKLNSCIIT